MRFLILAAAVFSIGLQAESPGPSSATVVAGAMKAALWARDHADESAEEAAAVGMEAIHFPASKINRWQFQDRLTGLVALYPKLERLLRDSFQAKVQKLGDAKTEARVRALVEETRAQEKEILLAMAQSISEPLADEYYKPGFSQLAIHLQDSPSLRLLYLGMKSALGETTVEATSRKFLKDVTDGGFYRDQPEAPAAYLCRDLGSAFKIASICP